MAPPQFSAAQQDSLIAQIRADTTPAGQLVLAAAAGDTEEILSRLAQDVSVRAPNERGWMPLHVAAAFGRSDTIRVLVDRGAVVDEPDRLGWSPVTWAAWQASVEGVSAMLALGANPNGAGREGETPLNVVFSTWHLVTELGPASSEARLPAAFTPEIGMVIARALLAAGADPNQSGSSGPPLESALYTYGAEAVSLLLEHGAKLRNVMSAGHFINGGGRIGQLLRTAAKRQQLDRDDLIPNHSSRRSERGRDGRRGLLLQRSLPHGRSLSNPLER